MSMSWQELRKEAYQLSVSDRLLLVEAIVRSLSNKLRPCPPTSIIEARSKVIALKSCKPFVAPILPVTSRR